MQKKLPSWFKTKTNNIKYKSPCFTDNSITITKTRRLILYMKATGIVRRIEARVIITQKSLKAA